MGAVPTHPVDQETASRTIRKKLGRPAGRLIRDLRQPNLSAVRAFVLSLAECIGELNTTAGLSEEDSWWLQNTVPGGTFPALICYRRGDVAAAADWIANVWRTHLAALLGTPLQLPVTVSSQFKAPEPLSPKDEDSEFLSLFTVASEELLSRRRSKAEGRQILRDLTLRLGLSQDELGRMFGVTGETVRRWERGQNEIPPQQMARLVSAYAGLRRLLEIFRPEKLPQAIRRNAELFGGERALDWILRGRIADVADRYESALTYQA